ncbi:MULTISPECIES: hypothetical protein [unclassified Methylophaga]|jgi:hypothetical protein|uniref:hypothetical protein n=1 Tax=unclassified Methylophaga TaxID=2629249 RepID=UPI000C8AC77A|nr:MULTISPECIES: hypothetical protein [unclassified Methylophaga]MAK66212.1 hypothetical protein [Methylophaga sp.]MAY17407.1 hypothetical protein [Methylophaga sp.]HAO25357.1 hypothetical protein [Methylophaga sp.]HCD04796.1 hypothetical protein [Methylophaga sp.]|tara:strand:- start:5485 stop:5919 length:435 start_codon:yes stop_codon:yes gene_type:complete
MQELINGLLVWAVTLTGYQQPVDLPVVEAVSHQQLVKTLCEDQFCTAVAYYDTDTQIIYYDERMQLEQDQSARGFIIHEMVHYLQDLNGELVPSEMSCEQRIEKEQEAYRVQQYFLQEHKEPTFQIDLAVAVLSNVCKTNNVVE